MSLEQPKDEIKKTPEELRSLQEVILEKNKIDSNSELGGGMNETRFVRIKDDGDGVFKPDSKERGGTSEIGSGYKRERAVYLVDMFLGFNLVPPTIIRTIDGEEGSLQQFISDSQTGRELDRYELGNDQAFMEQAGKMTLLDMLIGNEDRHLGNFVKDKNGKFWAIDNGDSFSRGARIVDDMYAINKKASEFIYTDEAVKKLKDLAEDGDKKEILSHLLGELVGKKEVALFLKRLELISNIIIDNRISGVSLDMIREKLGTCSVGYDENIRNFIKNHKAQHLTQQDVVDQLFAEGQMWAIADNLELFEGLDKDVALKLIEAHEGHVVIENSKKFNELVLNKDIAWKLIETRQWHDLGRNLLRFEGLDREIAMELIEAHEGEAVVGNWEKFEGLDKEVALVLIQRRDGWLVDDEILKMIK